MNDAAKIKIAAVTTALFLAVLTAGGVALRADHALHPPVTAAPTQAAQQSVSQAGQDDEAEVPNAGDFSEIGDE